MSNGLVWSGSWQETQDFPPGVLVRNSSVSGASACLRDGPWQDSQPTEAKWGVVFSLT